jgi:hypothetical protein
MKKEILIGTISAVCSGIILMIIEPSRHFIIFGIGKVGKFFKILFSGIWNYLTTIHEINGFIIIISGLILSFFIFILFIIIKDSLFGKTYATYTTYIEDMFYGIKWRWYWDDKEIKNLWCFCPECEYELSYQEESSYRNRNYNAPLLILICDHCSKKYPFRDYDRDYLLSIIKREIWRKIRIGEKPEQLQSPPKTS